MAVLEVTPEAKLDRRMAENVLREFADDASVLRFDEIIKAEPRST